MKLSYSTLVKRAEIVQFLCAQENCVFSPNLYNLSALTSADGIYTKGSQKDGWEMKSVIDRLLAERC